MCSVLLEDILLLKGVGGLRPGHVTGALCPWSLALVWSCFVLPVFQVPLFIPALFSFTCLFMVVLSLYSDPFSTGVGFLITLTGVPAYYLFIVWDKKPKWFRQLSGTTFKPLGPGERLWYRKPIKVHTSNIHLLEFRATYGTIVIKVNYCILIAAVRRKTGRAFRVQPRWTLLGI